MKTFNQSNCVASVRNRVTDKYGREIILCGQHAFTWSITIVYLTGKTINFPYSNGKIAREEFKKFTNKRK